MPETKRKASQEPKKGSNLLDLTPLAWKSV
jgi:hypothetical protein